MGLPIAAIQVGIADRVATMEHPAVAHIDTHMRNARCVIGADKEHQITGPGAARPGADIIKALRPQPPKAPAALIVDVADEAGAVKGCGGAAAAPHIGAYDITADELLAGTDTAKTESKTVQAQMLILELLADGKRMPSAELEKAVNERGISSRTMRTAKSRIGDRLVTEKDGTAWVCYLRD